jgi:hypothetical protein
LNKKFNSEPPFGNKYGYKPLKAQEVSPAAPRANRHCHQERQTVPKYRTFLLLK